MTLDRRYDGAVYGLQSACLAFDWIVEQVCGLERAKRREGFLGFVNAQVAEIAAGSGNLLATHWSTDELPPFSKAAKGVYLNLTTVHDRAPITLGTAETTFLRTVRCGGAGRRTADAKKLCAAC